MKLVLVNPMVPHRPGLAQSVLNRHPPLSLAILAGLSPRDWEIVVQDENYEPATIIQDADLVGITAFTSQAPRAYELAGAYHDAGVPVVMGGIHAWARPDEASQFANCLILGEADGVWSRVCNYYSECSSSPYLRKSASVSRWHEGAPAPRVFALPDRHYLRPEYPVDSIQTSRGCLNRCSFCSVHKFGGGKFRRQPLDLVVRDMAAIKSKRVFVVDDNFPGFTRQHAADATAILREWSPFHKELIIQAHIDIRERTELLEAAREAGVRLIFIGMEAKDEEGLESVRALHKLRKGHDLSSIHLAGIGVIGSFIFGLPTDTPQTIKERARFMVECGADVLQMTILTPLPGTDLFDRLFAQGRLIYTDWPGDWREYDFTQAVFLPDGFNSLGEFYDLMYEVVMEVYSDDAIRMMEGRTRDACGVRVGSFSRVLNDHYRDIMLSKAALWRDFSRLTEARR